MPPRRRISRSSRGKILRFNTDGTAPTDNPFYDGPGPNYDAIWALGLRNPFRAYYDPPTGRLFIGDVGGNIAATAWEEINLGARGANYGWPNVRGAEHQSRFHEPDLLLSPNWSRLGGRRRLRLSRDAVPGGYQGSYFFADYTQNWIKRLTLRRQRQRHGRL